MDGSNGDDGYCVKEEWSALFKPNAALDSIMGNYKCCLEEGKKNQQVSVSMPFQRSGWCGASSGKHLEALQLCTEGLGFESSDETETDTPTELSMGQEKDTQKEHENEENTQNEIGEEDGDESGIPKRQAVGHSKFPPPLPSIARNSQAGVILRSFKKDGRFVLQEVKKLLPSPEHEVLHAWRGDGRLKLHLIHKDDHPNSDCHRI